METQTAIKKEIGWKFDNSYLSLPEVLFSKVSPTPVPSPQIILFNNPLAKKTGLQTIDAENRQAYTDILGGNKIPEGSEPIAQAYMGHQFGYINMLGDGRAILLGEQIIPSGNRIDIQLKGPGRTDYSRGGDGRATLYSMLREYIISEAMHHLGIPTSRSLAVVATGMPVYREETHQGAVLTRLASSHIRVGTFEFASRNLSKEDFTSFTQYVIKRHYPEISENQNPAISLLRSVMEKQAELIAEWMRVGFIHGVMNTDNMSISGETFDYGPCAFINGYHPDTVFSSIDTGGRYAFGNQPAIAQWNLAVLASALMPLIDDDSNKALEKAKSMIHSFPEMYQDYWLKMMRRKLGLITELEGDKELAEALLSWMETHRADYTNTFYNLNALKMPVGEIYQEDAFKIWFEKWRNRLAQNEAPESVAKELMTNANPAFIPRNHIVEEALEAATKSGDFSKCFDLLGVMSTPYQFKIEYADYQKSPSGHDTQYKTFCGT